LPLHRKLISAVILTYYSLFIFFWIHDLRHTYATIRLLRGHNIGDVSYQSGHFSINIIYDFYTFWMPGHFNNDELDNPSQDLQIAAEGRI